MNENPIDFLEAISITYECPKCGHTQKQTFRFKKTNVAMKFACKKCNFENEMTITDDDKGGSHKGEG